MMHSQTWFRLRYSRWLEALALLTAVLGLLTLAGAFLYAPTDSIQGDVQRVFYIHAPIAFCSYLAGAVVAASGLVYLITRNIFWDVVARCSAECAVLFTSLMLVTGSLWGRPVWGTWWTWDARLTTALVLWFIFVGYLMLRSYVGDVEKAARYSVLVGVLGALDIPLVHVSVEWWRTLHPQGVIDSASGAPALPGSMLAVFAIGALTMPLLYVVLMGLRIRLELLRQRLSRIEDELFAEADERAMQAGRPFLPSTPISSPEPGS